jgi:hypothetical protein
MRRPSGKIAMLPEAVRAEINRKIGDGWQYRTITDWLFAQRAEQDIPDLKVKTGDLYALAWTRDHHQKGSARDACVFALHAWFKKRYPVWLKEEMERDQAVRLVEQMEQLSRVAGEKAQPGSSAGGNLIIRSLLMEAIRALCRSGEKHPAHLARLANAWARMNDTGVRGQRALDSGLQALRDEIKGNPKALELFNKLYSATKVGVKRNP